MPRLTLLKGTVAAGEGVVRLAPTWAAPNERWLASTTEPHLSQIAVGTRRLELRAALTQLPEWYLGPERPDWNVFARLAGGWLILQPIVDAEHGPTAQTLKLKPGTVHTLKQDGPCAVLCQTGHGTVGRADVQAPAEVIDGRLLADELFVTGEAARRGVPVRNTGTVPLVLLIIHS